MSNKRETLIMNVIVGPDGFVNASTGELINVKEFDGVYYIWDPESHHRHKGDREEWSKMLEKHDNIIKQNTIERNGHTIFVSTVFLGMPNFFETMVFVDGESMEQEREYYFNKILMVHDKFLKKYNHYETLPS